MTPVSVIAAAYLALHVPFLAPSLEDYDSINFALGLRDFDPARHQPHPPGSPVYIALGRVLLPVVSGVSPSLSRTETEALTLAIWSVVAGVIAIVALARVFAAVARLSAARGANPSGSRGEPTAGSAPRLRGGVPWLAPPLQVLATALFAVSPLVWMSGLRPMSDLPGLAAALVAQALILQGTNDRQRLVQGALVSGLAAGIRVQTAFLTLPLLGLALFKQFRVRPLAALGAGILVWAVPLVADSGGVDGYVRALGSQAGEDFAWVNMLWLEPTPRRLALALYETFVLPWASNPLAAVVAAAAAVGALLMLARERQPLTLLLVAFAPYAIFHLLFQETITVRYALPTLPLVAWLAARGIAAAGRHTPALAMSFVAGALIVSMPATLAYGREPHPAFQAIADASRYARLSPPAAVYSHHSLWRALQADSRLPPTAEPPRLYEWLGPVNYWKNGGAAPIWFFADPRRTDLALIDPRARLDVVRYRWAVTDRPELSGARPTGADWYRIAAPGWFAAEGWSLTPETGGLARASAAGPDHRPIEAWVRRRAGPMHLMIGGRHLGEAGDPPAEFELAMDGVFRDRWTVSVEQRNFLRFLDLPDGIAGADGAYARLTIVSRAAGGAARRAPVGVRQFDIQAADQMLYAYGDGWHEEEYDVATGRRWRWTSERSVLRVKGVSGDLGVTLRGESPLRYFDAPPTVRVTAGGRLIGQFQPNADFEWTVTVPADELRRAQGAVAVETIPVYLPGPAEGTADERHLGLRIFECRVYPISP